MGLAVINDYSGQEPERRLSEIFESKDDPDFLFNQDQERIFREEDPN